MLTRGDGAMRAFFEEHGWAVVRGGISTERVAELKEALEGCLERYGEHVQEVTPGVRQLAGVCRMDPVAKRFLFETGEVAGWAREVLGCEGLQLQQDLVMVKPPGGVGEIGWHQDHGYARYLQPARAVGVRVALSREDEGSGCMVVLDGSHTWGYCLALEERNWFLEGTHAEVLPERLASQVEALRVPIELEPGDVSLHHCLTVHGSSGNASEHERMTLITHVFDAACVLDPAGLPHPDAYFPTDREGHVSPLVFPVLE